MARIREFTSLGLRRFPNLPEIKTSEYTKDLRYLQTTTLDITDIYRILRAEGYLATKTHPYPTPGAYFVVYKRDAWHVPPLELLLNVKYALPNNVKDAVRDLIAGMLRIEVVCGGWQPPGLEPELVADEFPEPPDADVKDILKEEVERFRSILLERIKVWAGSLATTEQDAIERIDSTIRWFVRHDYNCQTSQKALLAETERRKDVRKEYGRMSGKRPADNPVRDRILVKCQRLPHSLNALISYIKAPPRDAELDGIGHAKMLPLFRWVGGKRRQVHMVDGILDLLEHRPTKIIEPFCGAAAMSLGLGMKDVHINDRNPGLINYYRYVRSGRSIETSYLAVYHNYMALRLRYNSIQATVKTATQGNIAIPPELQAEWASLFRFLIEHSYNGVWRTNASGSVNHPPKLVNSMTALPVPNNYKANEPQFAAIAKNWVITNRDFRDVPVGDENTLLYLDPPYHQQYGGYDGSFSDKDQIALFDMMMAHKGPVICHNTQTELILLLCAKYRISAFPFVGKTSVAAKAASRGDNLELLIFRGTLNAVSE